MFKLKTIRGYGIRTNGKQSAQGGCGAGCGGDIGRKPARK